MHSILITLALFSASPEFDVQTLDGSHLSGQVVELDGTHLTLETPKGRASLEVEKVASLAAKQPPAASGKAPAVWVELVDGSSLVAEEYTAREGRARIAVIGGEPIELPTRDIATIRFQSGSVANAGEWSRIAGMKLHNDLLVVNKGESIDYHKGAVHNVTDQHVQFDLDGEVLAVKRSKVYGFVYYHAEAGEQPEAACSILDAAGSLWSARTLALGGKLEWTTPTGVTVRRPLDQVAQIDLSRGKIVYLSDLKPDSATYTPYFGLDKELPARLEFFRPRKDQNLESKPLRLGGKQYNKGLALHSRTEMAFYLPGRFKRFQTTAGIDDDVRPRGNVRLVVRGDDKVLWEGNVTGAEPPKPIEADLTGVRRLAILVDFGEELDVADHLDLGDARVSK